LIYENPGFTWDIQWLFVCWKNNSLCVYPSKNLVKNIGFDGQYTNTLAKKKFILETPLESIGKLKHPARIERNFEADKITFNRWFKKSALKLVLDSLPIGVQVYLRSVYVKFLRR